MSDILVTSPYRPFTLPNQFKAVFNGYIYCGTVDAVDPSVSQVQVYLVNESGDKVPVSQPLRTNAGGFLVYNGQPAKFVTDSNHSLLVRDSLGNQVWYAPNMANIDPQSFADELAGPGGAGLVGGTIPVITDPKFAGGGVGDGVVNNGPMFVAAAAYVGDGGSVLIPPGRWRIAGDYALRPVNFIGSGQGATVIEFDMTLGKFNGLNFQAPTIPQVGFGITNATIKVIGGRGGNAIITPTDSFVNLFPKPTFEHLSFCSDSANDPAEGFAQAYSWDWMFLLGDAMCLTMRAIDALGSYKPTVDPTLQNLDGFIRTVPTQGILSMRCSNITTHNVAKFFEIKQKTYFSMHNVDVARAWTGFTDAPDRVFEGNRYAYGEANLNFVVINAQKACFDLKNRYFTNLSNVAVQRASDGFDHGTEWVGVRYDDGWLNQVSNLAVNYPVSGFTGAAVGYDGAGGIATQIANISLGGALTSGIRLKGRSLDNSANQGTTIDGVNLHSIGVTTVFDLAEARGARISGFTKSSGVTYGAFVTYGNSSTQQSCFFQQSPTDNTAEFDDDLFWVRPNGGADAKRWRWQASDGGLNLSTQGDTFAVGNNAILFGRTGLLIDKVELRTRNTAGGFVYCNSPETQFAGFIKPTSDNASSCGTAPSRWSVVYAGTGAINTSDAREKTAPMAIDDSVLDAWGDVQLVTFQWLESIRLKGDDARWHFGVIAQQVRDAFAARGLDGCDYGLLCYDEWEDQFESVMAEREVIAVEHAVDHITGEVTEVQTTRMETYDTGERTLVLAAGNRWGIRPDQCLFLEAAYQRRRSDRIEARLAAAGL